MRTTNLNRKFLEKFLKYIKAKLELTYANFYSTQIDEVGLRSAVMKYNGRDMQS